MNLRVFGNNEMHHEDNSSIMLSAIDSEERLQAFMPVVEQMVEEGLVVLSKVDIIKYAYRAEGLDQAETGASSPNTPAQGEQRP